MHENKGDAYKQYQANNIVIAHFVAIRGMVLRFFYVEAAEVRGEEKTRTTPTIRQRLAFTAPRHFARHGSISELVVVLAVSNRSYFGIAIMRFIGLLLGLQSCPTPADAT